MFEVGKALNWQRWKLNFFIQGHLTETQVQHQLLHTLSSPHVLVYLERLWLSDHEKMPPLLFPGLTAKIRSSRAFLQYQLLQGVPLAGAWIIRRITSRVSTLRPMIVTAMGETLLLTHPWESPFIVLSCSASPRSCCWTSPNHLISSLLI